MTYHDGLFAAQLPLSLLRAAKGSAILVELKSGETYNGHLVSTDAYMNVTVSDVICTASSGDKFFKLASANIRGSAIKYLRLPDNCLELAQQEDEKQNDAMPRGGGGGRRGGGYNNHDGQRGSGGRHSNSSGGRHHNNNYNSDRGGGGRGSGRGGGRGYGQNRGGPSNTSGGRGGGRYQSSSSSGRTQPQR